MYHTTGFTKDEIADICAMIYTGTLEGETERWPPILGLFRSGGLFIRVMLKASPE